MFYRALTYHGDRLLIGRPPSEPLPLGETTVFLGACAHRMTAAGEENLPANVLCLPDYIWPGCLANRFLQLSVVEGGIRLGPVLGIMVEEKALLNLRRGKYIPRVANHLTALRSSLGVLFVFSPGHLDLPSGQVEGTCFDWSTGQWLTGVFPLPRVVYDQGYYRGAEVGTARQVRSAFKSRDLPVTWLNTKAYFPKWTSYNKLKSTALAPFLPRSWRYKHPLDAYRALELADSAYVKGNCSSRSQRVVKLTCQGTVFHLSWPARAGKRRHETFSHPDTLHRYCLTNLGRRLVIQSGIQLWEAGGAPVVFKLLAQKDGSGAWTLAGIQPTWSSFADVPPPQENPPREVLTAVLDNFDWPKIAVQCALEIEKAFGHHGELGLDLAVDIEKKIWLLEVNAKPGKCTWSGKDGGPDEIWWRPVNYLLHYENQAGSCQQSSD